MIDAAEFKRRMALGRSEQSLVMRELLPFIHRCVKSSAARCNVYNSDVRDDVQQQVCMILLRSWPDLREDGSLEGWIYRISHNLIRAHLRSVGRSPILSTLDGTLPEDEPDAERQNKSLLPEDFLVEKTCLGRALGVLSGAPAARKGSMRVFDVLMFMVSNDDPSDKELAEFLNTSTGAARERRSQIRKKLKETCMQVCGRGDCRFAAE